MQIDVNITGKQSETEHGNKEVGILFNQEHNKNPIVGCLVELELNKHYRPFVLSKSPFTFYGEVGSD